jgi:uncharacterized glyoxalase superfamily protein PhnB
MEHPTVFPTLSYDDAQAAIDFLVQAFGATRHAVYSGDDRTIQHAEVRFGNGIVMLGSSTGEMPATRGRGEGVYIVVADPDEHHARAREAGAEIVRELQTPSTGRARTRPRIWRGTAGTSALTSRSNTTTRPNRPRRRRPADASEPAARLAWAR